MLFGLFLAWLIEYKREMRNRRDVVGRLCIGERAPTAMLPSCFQAVSKLRARSSRYRSLSVIIRKFGIACGSVLECVCTDFVSYWRLSVTSARSEAAEW